MSFSSFSICLLSSSHYLYNLAKYFQSFILSYIFYKLWSSLTEFFNDFSAFLISFSFLAISTASYCSYCAYLEIRAPPYFSVRDLRFFNFTGSYYYIKISTVMFKCFKVPLRYLLIFYYFSYSWICICSFTDPPSWFGLKNSEIFLFSG